MSCPSPVVPRYRGRRRSVRPARLCWSRHVVETGDLFFVALLFTTAPYDTEARHEEFAARGECRGLDVAAKSTGTGGPHRALEERDKRRARRR